MAGVDGLRMWIMTLVEYDTFGNGKIISSFAKPAADSMIKAAAKKKKKKAQELKTPKFEETALF